ncbi:MAG: LON peptidase substrate-binding domain-containing protein, partial [Chloroflexi bacterium]|nr:LON peptidase substrate-binding domain-containing protein [Chloroflexota bacterium]
MSERPRRAAPARARRGSTPPEAEQAQTLTGDLAGDVLSASIPARRSPEDAPDQDQPRRIDAQTPDQGQRGRTDLQTPHQDQPAPSQTPAGDVDQPTTTEASAPERPPTAVPLVSTASQPELELPSNLAILPSRDAVLYPGMLMPLQASDQQWVRLLSDAVSSRQPIGLVLLREPSADPSQFANLHEIGTAANIVRLLKLPDGSLQVLLQGAARIRLAHTPSQTEPYLRSDVETLASGFTHTPSVQIEGLVKNLQTLFQRVVSLSPVLPDEMAIAAANVDDPGRLADFIAANIDLDVTQRQDILQELDPLARAHRVTEQVTRELEVLEIGSKIQSQIRESMEKTQRDFYLRQQLEAIRKELGEGDSDETALADLRHKLAKIQLPPEAQAEATRELNRLSSIPAASPEHSMVRTYLEWLADLPWSIATQDDLDLHHAKRVLDEDHFNLTRVKDRILEYLAVMKLRADREAALTPRPLPEGEGAAIDALPKGEGAAVGALPEGEGATVTATGAGSTGPVASVRGPILCLVGPPGVGKTSLGQSIARALGRKFVHMSLGGVRDEAEIRGHRRTYIGALPGRIIQALRRAGSRNPVFILDELDKLGNDWRGDPSSALLEVLDPAQNSDFRDHYLDVPFDLSNVLFIATANVMDT